MLSTAWTCHPPADTTIGVSLLLARTVLATVALYVCAGAYVGSATPLAPTGSVTSPSRSLGVFIPWSSRYLNDLDAYTALVGLIQARNVVFGLDEASVPVSRLDAVTRRGATPQITWEPWDAGGTANQPMYSLARINAGAYDAYIRASASAAAAYGKPFQIRFAHEMNAGWTSWGAGVNSNTGNQYVTAWRRVVAIFRARGATNVSWVWAPTSIRARSRSITPETST